MATATATGLSNPLVWISNALVARREAKAARATMLRELGICTVCRANTASADTDYRCTDCDLECASVP